MRTALGCVVLALLSIAIAFGQPSKQTYTYKTVGNCAIKLDVYRPAVGGARPVIFWIHGGALIMGDRIGIRAAQFRKYIEAGYAIVSIDYRLAPETKLPEILKDVEDAYAWVRAKADTLQIDPKRIAVVGHSAGGYLTLTSGYRFHPRPRALVAFYGYGDIAGDWYSRPDAFYLRQAAISKEQAYAGVNHGVISEAGDALDRDKFYVYTRQQGLWPLLVSGIDPHTQPRAFYPYSPVRNITRDYPPTMLLHGDKDTDVPFAQSEQMARALEKVGVEHVFVPVPGGEHGFDRSLEDPAAAAAFDRVLKFLAQHLQ